MTEPFIISVARQETEHYVGARTQGYRVILTLQSPVGFTDPGLFRFNRMGGNQDFFTGVCSPADLTDWLLNTPVAPDFTFRSATADLVYPSKTIAIEITDSILLELKTLCQEMKKLQSDLGIATNSVINSSAT